ncbi:YozE family protein [Ignavigranum ruoffiae]|uniref:Uncharacterized protein YozE, UPF0346 family n=1 Tax=Ignavigranum ruoffiae TaxID=89093 RepID=A0A1H8Z694_9LACT|nr:YozE family protein [Ignavigranum ruoffiae]SEP59985.1 Uncharacterized protein YozE, UPF0346 family [Ignavigranum ruoffiae]
MRPSFYQYIQRFYDPTANDPQSRLANAIHEDQAFPKQADDFDQISTYLEHTPTYSRLMLAFDEAWLNYQAEN